MSTLVDKIFNGEYGIAQGEPEEKFKERVKTDFEKEYGTSNWKDADSAFNKAWEASDTDLDPVIAMYEELLIELDFFTKN